MGADLQPASLLSPPGNSAPPRPAQNGPSPDELAELQKRCAVLLVCWPEQCCSNDLCPKQCGVVWRFGNCSVLSCARWCKALGNERVPGRHSRGWVENVLLSPVVQPGVERELLWVSSPPHFLQLHTLCLASDALEMREGQDLSGGGHVTYRSHFIYHFQNTQQILPAL